jgi:CMP-N-acetylneuraminic acid synthetase
MGGVPAGCGPVMIKGKSVLAVIPARGGSKGLHRKNILPLAGKPLIVWTIEAAKKSKYIDRCLVSTDDEEIALVSRENGGEVPFIRPKKLGMDDTTSVSVIKHALESIKETFKIILLLQPTSPLRSNEDIDSALEFFMDRNAPALVSVTKSTHPLEWSIQVNDDYSFGVSDDNLLKGKRRQDYKLPHTINGAIYIADISSFIKNDGFINIQTIAYKMPKEKSIDIDDKIDFLFAETIIRSNNENI